MVKNFERLEAVYIYIASFNEINLCKHRKTMCFS